MNPFKIIQFIRQHKLSKEDFCKLCDIDIQLLDNIVYYGYSVEFKIAERIADAMSIGVYLLYTYDY